MKTYCELCKCWYDENNQKTSPPEDDPPEDSAYLPKCWED
jgi:hypothetical protein